ncbi:MAG: hypothetical protein ACYSYM_15885, partial [Planctomycetota bacterium]
MTAWPLAPKSEARFYKAETHNTDECLFATGYAGFGRVGVLGFDPSTLTDRQKANSAQFWVSRIRAMLEDDPSLPRSTVDRRLRSNRMSRSIVFGQETEEPTNRSGRFRNQGRYELGQAQAANNDVMEWLYQGIKPLSIWWVIFLLTTLAVLLGPLDYKLLKRKGRLPLTWLTCTFWIALFTVGAYYGVQAL